MLAPRATEKIDADLRYRLGVVAENSVWDSQMPLAITLARTHAISLFHGFYLLLAMQLRIPLVTRDAGLSAAAGQEACPTLYVGAGS